MISTAKYGEVGNGLQISSVSITFDLPFLVSATTLYNKFLLTLTTKFWNSFAKQTNISEKKTWIATFILFIRCYRLSVNSVL